MRRLLFDVTVYNANQTGFFIIIILCLLLFFAMLALGVLLAVTRKNNARMRQMQSGLYSAEEVLSKDAQILSAKEHLSSIINAAPIAFFMWRDDYILESNKYAEDILGIRPGGYVPQIYSFPEEHRRILAELDDCGAVYNKTVRFRSKTGEVLNFTLNVTTVAYDKNQALAAWAINAEARSRDLLQTGNNAKSAEHSQKDLLFLAGLDTDAAVARFGGRESRFIEALSKFIGSLPECPPVYSEVLEDKENFARTIHSLKGVSGNLGVLPVYNAAVEFEKTLRAGEPCERRFNELYEKCGAMKKQITPIISRNSN